MEGDTRDVGGREECFLLLRDFWGAQEKNNGREPTMCEGSRWMGEIGFSKDCFQVSLRNVWEKLPQYTWRRRILQKREQGSFPQRDLGFAKGQSTRKKQRRHTILHQLSGKPFRHLLQIFQNSDNTKYQHVDNGWVSTPNLLWDHSWATTYRLTW